MLGVRNSVMACVMTLLCWGWISVSGPGFVVASDFDIEINEIHYNPASTDERDEFVEVFNRGASTVDLSGWSFIEGIALAFPEGMTLGPKEYLVVSPDRSYTEQRYGISGVHGDYTGRLANDGEIIALQNAGGETVSRIHYGDGNPWPSVCDGLGPSLELVDPNGLVDVPRNWAASLPVGGTPGAANSTFRVIPFVPETEILREDEVWRFFRGTDPFPGNWEQPGFSDNSWESGPTGIGYGDDDDATLLEDMQDNYLSIAARKRFDVNANTLEEAGQAVLSIRYDDGFIAYLNGVEFARGAMGSSGEEFPYDREALDTHEGDESEEFAIPLDLLVEGENVLAVQIHNATLDSSDLSFIPRVILRPTPPPLPEERPPSDLVINEIKPTETGSDGFVELYNVGSATVSTSGYAVLNAAGERFNLPARSVAPGSREVFSDNQLGFDVSLSVTHMLIDADDHWLDGLNPREGQPGENGFSFGRVPDGDDDAFVLRAPSEGSSNSVELEDAVVINEIYFHPPYVEPSGDCTVDCSDLLQWVELHNKSGAAVDISGWQLTSGIQYDFADPTSIAAGGFLVVAASRDAFLAANPTVPGSRVVGDWLRSLSHSSETVNLRDALGNLVDHVEYGDGKPVNDEDPDDDINDGTFRGSEWPDGADGSGRTLELIHPDLDNRFGPAWQEGSVGGSPATTNESFDGTPDPVVSRARHAPALPTPADDVVVSCRVSAVSSIAQVSALWHVDETGISGTATLRDDGTGGDEVAGDGRYSGEIPAQADNAVVAYQISVELGNGDSALYPHPPEVSPYEGFEGPFYLYRVSNQRPLGNGSVNYFLIMTRADQNELEDRDPRSDVLLHGTFIAHPGTLDERIRYLVGIRYRGGTSRFDSDNAYRIEFPSDRRFEDIQRLNLNAADIATELLAADLFRRAGMPAPQEWLVNFTFQSDLNSRYARKEHLDADFLTRWYGDADDDGNFYRALDPDDDELPLEGDLSYLGPDPELYRPYYPKRNNREEDDYSDLIELCRIFDPNEVPDDEEFADLVEDMVDVNQWCRFFAVQSCLANRDGSIQTGTGEDYFLYHIPESSPRPHAGKWVLVPWDIEETYDNEDTRLFRTSLATYRRFLTHPRFAPRYYCNLVNLRRGVFSRRESRQRFQLIDFIYGLGTTDSIDSFVTARLGFFDENIPVEITAGTTSTSGQSFIDAGVTWRFFRGTEEPSGGSLAWTERGFDHSTWEQGIASIGYGDGDDLTELLDMENNYSTVYLRRRFAVEDVGAIDQLFLGVDYDDGFVAYLNETEIARRNFGDPGTPMPFDETATDLREAGEIEWIDVSEFLDDLVEGVNVLAVQGANLALDSSDFSLAPQLRSEGLDAGGLGCGEFLVASEDSIGLGGFADACATRAVEVDGVPAEWDAVGARWNVMLPMNLGENIVTVQTFDAAGFPLESKEIVVQRMAGGFTQVSGELAADTVWTEAGGPYVMLDHVLVPDGVRLTIQPGARIFGQSGASILVEGEIAANGTASNPILFRAAACDNRWGGIGIIDTGTGAASPTHVFRHCDLEFGNAAPGFAGTLAPNGSKLLVEDCQFRFLTDNAIEGNDSRVEVRDTRFEKIHEGVHCTDSTVIVLDCHFEGMIGDKDAIDFDGNGTEFSRIERCTFLHGSDDGVDLGNTSVFIRDNFFFDIQDKSISLEGNGPLGAPIVTGNIILNGGTGIALKDGVNVTEGRNNTIVGNQEGILLQAKSSSQGGSGTLDSNIIWNNIRDVVLDDASSVTILYSNVSDSVWPGAGNISQNPMFADPLLLDFSLLPGSPCIDSGLDGVDMGAVPFSGPPVLFVRGDANENGGVNLTDAMNTLNFVFQNGPTPACLDRMDANDDATIDIGDALYTVFYLYADGPEPPAPFPAAGPDPTPDRIPCR